MHAALISTVILDNQYMKVHLIYHQTFWLCIPNCWIPTRVENISVSAMFLHEWVEATYMLGDNGFGWHTCICSPEAVVKESNDHSEYLACETTHQILRTQPLSKWFKSAR